MVRGVIEMANKSDGLEVGTYLRGAQLETVELAEALTASDRGLPLKVTGIAADHTLKVSKADTAADTPNFVSIKGSEGAVGDYVEVLLKGDVVVKTVDGAITVGSPITNKDGVFAALPSDTTGYYPHSVGFARSEFADGDDGLVCFRGI